MKRFSVVLLALGLLCLPSLSLAIPEAPSMRYVTHGLNITVSWSEIQDATGYRLYYAPFPYEGEHTIAFMDMESDRSFSIDLWDGANYYIAASAYNATGESEYSNIELFTIDSNQERIYFSEPRLLLAEEDDGRSVSGHYTIGDDRILVSAVGDFDGNGFDDILMAFPGYDDLSGNKVGSPIRIYLSNSNGALNEATNTIIEGPIPATQFTRRTFVADFNGDGVDDVFLANHGLELPSPNPGIDWHEPDTLLLSSPGGKLIDASSYLPANDFYSHGGAIGDIDGDGDIDILTNTNNWPPSGIQVYLNNGNGTFTLDNSGIPQVEYMPGHFTGVSGALWIELLDADNDGDLDLFKAGNTPDDHYIALNNGKGDFSIEPPIILPPLKWSNFGIEGASVADFNLDGLSDLLLVETDSSSNPWNHELQLLISNGDGTFTNQTAARLPAPADVTTNTFTHIADLNQDGSPEILFMLRQAINPLPDFYLNDGTGNFSRIGDGYLPDDFPASYHPIDLSNDGDIDFVISGLWSEGLGLSGTFVLEATRVPSF